jgi:hypothetical protein
VQGVPEVGLVAEREGMLKTFISGMKASSAAVETLVMASSPSAPAPGSRSRRQHAAGVEVDGGLAAGQLLQALLHQGHRLMDRVRLVEPVRELEHDAARADVAGARFWDGSRVRPDAGGQQPNHQSRSEKRNVSDS